jgi:hypothetical protein
MAQSTVLISSAVTPNPYNISKFSAYKSPLYQQNCYSLVNSGSVGNNIETQYAEIILSIVESVQGALNSIIFVLKLVIPVIQADPIIFLGVYNSTTNTIPITLNGYTGKITFLSNSNGTFELNSGDGKKIFLSTLSKYN